MGIEIDDRSVPVSDAVAGACELLGLDPLYVACEGRMLAFVAAHDADRAIATLRELPHGEQTTRIGTVGDGPHGMVALSTTMGSRRLLDLLSGEQLPRIC